MCLKYFKNKTRSLGTAIVGTTQITYRVPKKQSQNVCRVRMGTKVNKIELENEKKGWRRANAKMHDRKTKRKTNLQFIISASKT